MKFPRYSGKVTHSGKSFVEEGTFRFQGRDFTSGGAYLLRRRDTGKFEAALYAYPKEGKVGTWDGKEKWPAKFGPMYQSNVGGMVQHVSTTVNGIKMGGILGTGKDFIKMREGR